ncbi:MAG: hypothetical protein ACRD63_03160 [Pyrinomonadaceae bacterium]
MMKSVTEINEGLKRFPLAAWRKIRDLLFDNWILKLIALAIAIVLWYIVVGRSQINN